jgi:hypothetical protein
MVPNDPQTNQSYEYNIINAENLTFELCATFNKEGSDIYGETKPMSIYTQTGFASENWQHIAGRTCFERTIDKQLYPPFTKVK